MKARHSGLTRRFPSPLLWTTCWGRWGHTWSRVKDNSGAIDSSPARKNALFFRSQWRKSERFGVHLKEVTQLLAVIGNGCDFPFFPAIHGDMGHTNFLSQLFLRQIVLHTRLLQ